MKIALLSDIHMSHDGKPIWDTDVNEHLYSCVEKLKKTPNIDIIIITGDLSNDGSASSYELVDNAFCEINTPIFCCPGNHDNIQNLQNTLQHIKYIKNIKYNNWHFIFLNSVIPDEFNPDVNKARGYLNKYDLTNLEKMLLQESCNTVIVMHHPAIEPEGWLNRRLLENKAEFIKIISKYQHVKMVLMGHSHEHYIKYINDIQFIIAPAIGYAFSASLPKFQIDTDNEGFLVIDTNRNTIKKILL